MKQRRRRLKTRSRGQSIRKFTGLQQTKKEKRKKKKHPTEDKSTTNSEKNESPLTGFQPIEMELLETPVTVGTAATSRKKV